MKYRLYKEVDKNFTPLQQVLFNRGIPIEQQEVWLNAGHESIYDWTALDADRMIEGCKALLYAINNEQEVCVNIDPDVDGYTSAAIIINYLYKRFPEYTVRHVNWVHHKGKEHGLKDIIDYVEKFDLVICPDSSSNDIEEHRRLAQQGVTCVVLDHHEISIDPDDSPAIIINVQSCDYPNKSLTGAGVAYKFISAFEDLYVHGFQPTEFYDLCALGNCGDMADLRQQEIRAIMNVGFANIQNPFFKAMSEKNEYKISQMNGINYLSVAFYVVPFINAVVRSGTMEDKETVFQALLEEYAYNRIASSKRGARGVEVPLYEEAVLVAERVKRKQTKLQDESMELLEKKIKDENLLDNAIILLLCEPGEVEKNIAGLVANKVQSKYQRPTAVLTRSRTKDDDKDYYRGSMRNYSLSPIEDLKGELEKTGQIEFCAGHKSAAGLGLAADQVENFLTAFNEQYKDVDQSASYWVDYIWNKNTVNGNAILDIGAFNIYGQEIPESLVVVEDICLDPSMITLMSPDKHPTLKIKIGNVDVIKFKSSLKEYEQFCQDDMVFTAICKCKINEWQGNISPQLIVEDFEIREEWVF